MKVLSLFDGISCGMVALERAGIPVERYVAYEIDENAIKVSRSNYPHIEQCGDVFAADFTQYSDFDLLIGGSPCTYWSVAKAGGGERSGTKRETTSSGLGWELFSQFVRALKETECKYFLYENNASMSKEIKWEITKSLHVEPVLIDSAEFSAQERKRLYWTNIDFSKEFPHCEKVIKDILYDINDELHRYRDFSKYADTIRWNADHTRMAYDTSGKGYYSQANRCRTIDSKSGTVPASKDDKNNIYWGGTTMKLIHPVEAERLQTLPDNYTKVLNTNSKRVSVVGNGWTVDVIAHIFKGLKKEENKMITEKNDYTDYINSIRNFVPDREMLEQLAEEAAELAQAAIKVIRAGEMAKGLPTPVKYIEAFENLVEEASDIRLILNIMGIYTTEPKENPKALRWYNRLIESGIPTEG